MRTAYKLTSSTKVWVLPSKTVTINSEIIEPPQLPIAVASPAIVLLDNFKVPSVEIALPQSAVFPSNSEFSTVTAAAP